MPSTLLEDIKLLFYAEFNVRLFSKKLKKTTLTLTSM